LVQLEGQGGHPGAEEGPPSYSGPALGATGRIRAPTSRALDIARSQSALLFELRAARDLARMLRGQGRVAEARSLLAPVYASFTEGFGFPDLVEARALLEELGASPPHEEDPVR
jgi:hypothetical protein